MSRHPLQQGYDLLVERLNKFPQGAPASDLLFRILSILLTEEEASLLSRLPLRPFSVATAAGAWKMEQERVQELLEGLASRGMLLDLEHEDGMLYFLPPPMAGFFEFSLMRMRPDIDQKELARLFYRYINVEEEFVSELFAGGETQLGRVLVSEPAIPPERASQVLDYERASEIIKSASHIAVGLCYCRHKMYHAGRACDAPLDNCLTLNLAAQSLIRHGNARAIDSAEGLDILQRARSLKLVQCADNVRKEVNFICNCCGCCCEGLIATRRLTMSHAMYSTNFLQKTDPDRCSGCGRCPGSCPVEAIEMREMESWDGHGVKKAVVNEEVCLGCGVCADSCSFGAIRLEPREKRVLTPVNSAHRLVLMAIERGKLQNLIFDNQAHLSHRAMARVLGAILKLPPVKRLMASEQMKSRYLARLLQDVEIPNLGRFD